MITLPCALGKAIFDIAWDLFRNRSNNDTSPTTAIEIKFAEMVTDPSKITEQAVQEPRTDASTVKLGEFLRLRFRNGKVQSVLETVARRLPIFWGTLHRLPYALLPFAFSEFILVEALSYTGWINVFSNWLAHVVGFSLPATVFFVGIVSVVLCNCSGTNIGATILLVKVLRHPNFASRSGVSTKMMTGAMLSLAVGSNIGAVSFTFSASLAGIRFHESTDLGLLWRQILHQKGIRVTSGEFIKWNMLPLLFMMVSGYAVVLAVVRVAP